MEEHDWRRLADQLRDSDCTPFLGSGACHPRIPTGRKLSKKLAKEFRFPFKNDMNDLARVAQYIATINDGPTVKRHVADIIRRADLPSRADRDDPHSLLATLPLPVYLTTNYDDSMFDSLKQVGKRPEQRICPWWKQQIPDEEWALDVPPTAETPVVYHLHGRAEEHRSMVLTHGDYLDFLTNMVRSQHDPNPQFIPTTVREALVKPLLFIGYSLQDWTFLVLFRGLLRSIENMNQRRHVSVQMRPPLVSDPQALERAEAYFRDYFSDWKISIYWGDARSFCSELRAQLDARQPEGATGS